MATKTVLKNRFKTSFLLSSLFTCLLNGNVFAESETASAKVQNLAGQKEVIAQDMSKNFAEMKPLIEHEFIGFSRDNPLYTLKINKDDYNVKTRLNFLEKIDRGEYKDIPKTSSRFNAKETCLGEKVESYFCYFFKLGLDKEEAKYHQKSVGELQAYMSVRDIFKITSLKKQKARPTSNEIDDNAKRVVESLKNYPFGDIRLNEIKNNQLSVSSLSEEDKLFLIENEDYIEHLFDFSRVFRIDYDYSIVSDLNTNQIGIKGFSTPSKVGLNFFMDNSPKSYGMENALIESLSELVYQNSPLVQGLGVNKQIIDLPFEKTPFVDEVHYAYPTTVNLFLRTLGEKAKLTPSDIWKVQLAYSNSDIQNKATFKNYAFAFNGKHSEWLKEQGFTDNFVKDLSSQIAKDSDDIKAMRKDAYERSKSVLEFYTRLEHRKLPMVMVDGTFVIRGSELGQMHPDLQVKIFEYVLLVNKLTKMGFFDIVSKENYNQLKDLGVKFKSSPLTRLDRKDWFNLAAYLFNSNLTYQAYEKSKAEQKEKLLQNKKNVHF